MITPEFVKMMARYNRWQNDSLYGAASTLTDDQRMLDRGAFFKSIHGTLNHTLWADRLWLSRFTDHPAPDAAGFDGSTKMYEKWDRLTSARRTTDQFIEEWGQEVTSGDLSGDLTWYSGAMGKELSRPCGLLIAHMFNHQTHHRGQVHGMLTAAGARPDDTDIPFMPGL